MRTLNPCFFLGGYRGRHMFTQREICSMVNAPHQASETDVCVDGPNHAVTVAVPLSWPHRWWYGAHSCTVQHTRTKRAAAGR